MLEYFVVGVVVVDSGVGVLVLVVECAVDGGLVVGSDALECVCVLLLSVVTSDIVSVVCSILSFLCVSSGGAVDVSSVGMDFVSTIVILYHKDVDLIVDVFILTLLSCVDGGLLLSVVISSVPVVIRVPVVVFGVFVVRT